MQGEERVWGDRGLPAVVRGAWSPGCCWRQGTGQVAGSSAGLGPLKESKTCEGPRHAALSPQVLAQQGEYSEAIPILRAALKLEPSNKVRTTGVTRALLCGALWEVFPASAGSFPCVALWCSRVGRGWAAKAPGQLAESRDPRRTVWTGAAGAGQGLCPWPSSQSPPLAGCRLCTIHPIPLDDGGPPLGEAQSGQAEAPRPGVLTHSSQQTLRRAVWVAAAARAALPTSPPTDDPRGAVEAGEEARGAAQHRDGPLPEDAGQPQPAAGQVSRQGCLGERCLRAQDPEGAVATDRACQVEGGTGLILHVSKFSAPGLCWEEQGAEAQPHAEQLGEKVALALGLVGEGLPGEDEASCPGGGDWGLGFGVWVGVHLERRGQQRFARRPVWTMVGAEAQEASRGCPPPSWSSSPLYSQSIPWKWLFGATAVALGGVALSVVIAARN